MLRKLMPKKYMEMMKSLTLTTLSNPYAGISIHSTIQIIDSKP